MKYYDARIIEGCCVFSYEVKTPDRSNKKGGKRKSAGQTNAAWKKALLRLILLLCSPFTFLWNCVQTLVSKISNSLRQLFKECSSCREITVCILSSISATVLIPLAFLIF